MFHSTKARLKRVHQYFTKKGTDNFMVNIPKPKDYDIENNKEKY